MNRTQEDVQYLYKYRSLDNFRNFVDIIVNKRLYGAKYDTLNDPFEGILLTRIEDLPQSLRNHKRKLQEERKNCRICSLSKVYDDNLMWSHYADGHRGCCIELSVVTNEKWQRLSVNYSDRPLAINENTTIEEVLSHKLSPWDYEKEVRYIVKEDTKYLQVYINKIYLGWKMSGPDLTFMRKLITSIDKSIKVEVMPKNIFL